MQTIAQQRAAFALKRVLSVQGNESVSNQEFKSYANTLPAMIHMNGFGQAMAFARSRFSDPSGGKSPSGGKNPSDDKGAAWKALYGILSKWLTAKGQPFHGSRDILTGITEKDMTTYMLGQAEALALCQWVQRFANAYLGDS